MLLKACTDLGPRALTAAGAGMPNLIKMLALN